MFTPCWLLSCLLCRFCFHFLLLNACIIGGLLQVIQLIPRLLWSAGLHLSVSVALQKITDRVHVPMECRVWILWLSSGRAVPTFFLSYQNSMDVAFRVSLFIWTSSVSVPYGCIPFFFLFFFLNEQSWTSLESRLQKFHWPSLQTATDLVPLSDRSLYIT